MDVTFDCGFDLTRPVPGGPVLAEGRRGGTWQGRSLCPSSGQQGGSRGPGRTTETAVAGGIFCHVGRKWVGPGWGDPGVPESSAAPCFTFVSYDTLSFCTATACDMVSVTCKYRHRGAWWGRAGAVGCPRSARLMETSGRKPQKLTQNGAAGTRGWCTFPSLLAGEAGGRWEGWGASCRPPASHFLSRRWRQACALPEGAGRSLAGVLPGIPAARTGADRSVRCFTALSGFPLGGVRVRSVEVGFVLLLSCGISHNL